jgi:hypothetical protein
MLYERCLNLERIIDELSKEKESLLMDKKELERIKNSSTKYIDTCEKENKDLRE